MSATGFQRRRRMLRKRREAERQEVSENSEEQKTGLAALSKKELLAYIGKKKLFDESYKQLEPSAIIPLFIKAVQWKIVEAKLKTEIEVVALPEKELLELYETIK